MTTLRDLVVRVETSDVANAIARTYQADNEWLEEAVADVMVELRRLTPDQSGDEYELQIEPTGPVEPGEPLSWEVCCGKRDDSERYGFDLSPWEEWLALRIPQSLQDTMPAAEIVAHCIWEMTFYGFTQERIAETRAELDRRMCEIDEGKAELIPMEQVMDKLRAKFGASDDESGGAGQKKR